MIISMPAIHNLRKGTPLRPEANLRDGAHGRASKKTGQNNKPTRQTGLQAWHGMEQMNKSNPHATDGSVYHPDLLLVLSGCTPLCPSC